MNKEPIGLYIFRYILGFAMFGFMAMLYWSSLLLEEDLKALHSDVSEIKGKINEVLSLVEMKDQHEGQNAPLMTSSFKNKDGKESSQLLSHANSERPHIDPSLPNLLEEDPFYTKTLPELLGKGFRPKGSFKEAVIGRPHNLHPFSKWSHISSWQELCSGSPSKMQFGKYETFSPDMAIKMEARKMKDSEATEFWVHLRDDLFWQPLKQNFFPEGMTLAPQFLKKQPVTAHDFSFFYDALTNPHVQDAGALALRTYYSDLEEIEVIDNLTFVVRWKTHLVDTENGKKEPRIKYMAKSLTAALKPFPSFVYKYFPNGKKIVEDDSAKDTYRTNSVFAQNFSEHWARNVIVSCGPWMFEGMSDREIKFARNPDFYFKNAALAKRSIYQFKESPESIWIDFKAGNLDNYNLPPNQQPELADFLESPLYLEQKNKGNAINRLDYLARSYVFIGWNQANPLFASKKVRQAMTMAIDRKRIIEQNLNGLGIEISCPFYRYSPSYDSTIEPWPFDLLAAKHLLEEDGWYDNDGDGILDKIIDGKPHLFRFSLTYFVKNSVGKAICEYIATALKELNITCDLNGVDIADLSATFDDKSFDAIFLGWALGTPPEDPKQLWYSSLAKEKGSSNAIGFANQEADEIIDALQYEYDEKKRIALYHRFDAIIHEEAPYTFLYSPKTAFLYRSYLQNVFIPADRQDLIPGANVAQPESSIFWLRQPI